MDGAVIGHIPLCDRLSPPQVKRDVLSKLLSTIGTKGVVNAGALSEYVRTQRRAASDSWADAMLLVMAGTVLDETFIADYPFNVRLYANLGNEDWLLLRSGKPFSASLLSVNARGALMEVLLRSKHSLESNTPDPAYWRSLDPATMGVTAQLEDETVLIGWTGFAAQVQTVQSSGLNHDMRKKELGREPLYQPARRQKLKLTITSSEGVPVETGFTEVFPNEKVKPSEWSGLPEAMAKEFKKAIEDSKNAQPVQGGGVPPPRQKNCYRLGSNPYSARTKKSSILRKA